MFFRCFYYYIIKLLFKKKNNIFLWWEEDDDDVVNDELFVIIIRIAQCTLCNIIVLVKCVKSPLKKFSDIALQAGDPGVTGHPAARCISRSVEGAGRSGQGKYFYFLFNIFHD